jgi:hypothetical protein
MAASGSIKDVQNQVTSLTAGMKAFAWAAGILGAVFLIGAPIFVNHVLSKVS